MKKDLQPGGQILPTEMEQMHRKPDETHSLKQLEARGTLKCRQRNGHVSLKQERSKRESHREYGNK